MHIAVLNQGDCLLHRDHHELQDECWAYVLDYMLARPSMKNGISLAETYKLDYEQAILGDLVTQAYESDF